MTAVKDNWLPDTEDLERLIYVEVRSSVGVLRVEEIGIASIRARVSIHAMGPRVVRFRREGMRKLMLDPGEQHVVVRLTLAAEGVNAIYQRVQWRPNNVSQRVCVIVVQSVMSGTALIANIRDPRVSQIQFHVE